MGVAVSFDVVSKFWATFTNNATIVEYVNEVRLYILQDASEVSDQKHTSLTLGANSIDSFGNNAQSVNVKTRVGLIQNSNLWIDKFHLKNFGALSFATREAFVDITFRELRINL